MDVLHKQKISESLKKAYKEKRRIGFVKGVPSPRKGKSVPGWTNSTSFKKGNSAPRTAYKKGDPRCLGNKNALGNIPWNKGIVWITLRGKNHPNWKGGMPRNRGRDASYDDFRKYTDWQKSVFKRDNWTCQHCGKHGGELHADHIKQWITHPKLRYELSNGRTLCPPCHRKTPTYGKKIKHYGAS